VNVSNTVVFSGSFNPVHIGHIAIANYVAEFTPADELWFVVSPHNPFKSKTELAGFNHRIDMVKMALADMHLPVTVCDIENTLPQPSYTVRTLETLEALHPDRTWSLLIGSDNLNGLDRWKDSRKILEKYRLIVYPRPGYDNAELCRHYNAERLEAPVIDLSSTFIRENIARGRNMRAFLPHGVFEHINRLNLYRNENTDSGR
jgi:nicotinate-nucleotide adenylyltransferase